MNEFVIDNPQGVSFEVDAETRTIKGLALPFGDVANNGNGKFSFGKGTLTWGKVKLLNSHDWSQVIGIAELEETDEGLVMSAKVARGARGDEILALAEMGAIDGLSVGLADDLKTVLRNGVQHAKSGTVREVSTTPIPAFERAAIRSVAASADALPNEKDTKMTDSVETPAPESVELSAVTDAIAKGFESLKAEAPVAVQPVHFEVTEEPLYRFDGKPGKHEFSSDIIAGLRDHDREAMNRVQTFMAEAFDVDTGNVSTLNPTRQRPDMYVDQRKFTTPLYDALHKGSLSDITPFSFPRFNSASGLVAPHVEGVEPTPGSFSATNQTVAPSAVSGKVEITREVWDQGGNPQVSSLIWNKMVYAYFQGLEASAVKMLDDASPEAIALSAGASDAALVDSLEEELAELNFIAGGNTFNFAAAQQDLFKALAGASDTTGRKLLPIIGATNANGQARSGFRTIDVAGTTFVPAWSLGASGTASESSYLVDTSSVHVWNTAPQRLEFQYRVAYVDLAIWGYVATAISDLNGVREITYDPVA